jgi:hypothetical protein
VPIVSDLPSASTVCSENSVGMAVVSDKDFDDGVLDGWTGMLFALSKCTIGGCIVIDKGHKPTKTALIPSGKNSVHVEFKFYEAGSWDDDTLPYGPDKFYVYVNDNLVDLGAFQHGVDENAQGYTKGIRWKLSNDFTALGVNVHSVLLDIPEKYLTTGTLTLGFEASTVDVATMNEPVAIDNLKIVACPT